MKHIFSTLVVLTYVFIGAFGGCAQQTGTTEIAKMDYRKDQIILEIALTPGGPESNSYAYTVYADGRVSIPGQTYNTASYQLSSEQLGELHSKLVNINFVKLSEEKNSVSAKPQVHDGQTKIVGHYQNGKFYRLSYQLGDEPIPIEVNDFHTYFLELVATLDSQDFAESSPLQALQISHIELEHTNPSMGIHEKIITIRLANNADTMGEINQFLSEAIINNSIPLSEFIGAYRTKNEEELKRVLTNFKPAKELNEGEQISNLTFYFSDTTSSLTFSDVYRNYSIAGFYGKFTQYMVDNGSRTETGTPIESLRPVDTDEDTKD
ncbi:hypothetical protein [Algoriphagus sp.]|uniref:hypothetical protein n=1 Tax=Algoriphagus sp. TaxID=1872435 RepID=UPI003F70D76C